MTPPDYADIMRLSLDLVPPKEIAERLGLTRERVHRVRQHLFRNGRLPKGYRHVTTWAPKADQVRIMTEDGASSTEIAAALGISRSHVSEIRYKLRKAGDLAPRRDMTASYLRGLNVGVGYVCKAIVARNDREFALWLAQKCRGTTLSEELVRVAYERWKEEKPRP
jgi:DNA-binding CsgD family transcriptional regulator